MSKVWTEEGKTDSDYVLVVNNNRDYSDKRILSRPLYDTLDWEVLKIFFEGGVWRYHLANRDHTIHRWFVPATALYGGSTGQLGQPHTREIRREEMDMDRLML